MQALAISPVTIKLWIAKLKFPILNYQWPLMLSSGTHTLIYPSILMYICSFDCRTYVTKTSSFTYIFRITRPYQREGVDWLSFLHSFHLNGALCDDMGLGKTLQTICMIAASTHEAREAATDAKNADPANGQSVNYVQRKCDDEAISSSSPSSAAAAAASPSFSTSYLDLLKPRRRLPSLVVCPGTLVGHWCHEIATFCAPSMHGSTIKLIIHAE
jgi:hypothetical protein